MLQSLKIKVIIFWIFIHAFTCKNLIKQIPNFVALFGIKRNSQTHNSHSITISMVIKQLGKYQL